MIAAAGIVLGGVVLVSESASADNPCAAADQRVGRTHMRDVNHTRQATKSAMRLKQAKKAYRKHHTKANKKRVAAAQKANRKAQAQKKLWHQRHMKAKQIAAKCAANNSNPSGLPTTLPSGIPTSLPSSLPTDSPVGPPDALGALTDALGSSLSPSTLTQLGDALGGGQLSPAQLQGFIDELQGMLSGGFDPSQLQSALSGVQNALPSGSSLDPSQLQSLLAALSNSGLSPDQLSTIASQISSALSGSGSGFTDNDIAKVIQDALNGLATDNLGTGTGLVPGIVSIVHDAIQGLDTSSESPDDQGVLNALNEALLGDGFDSASPAPSLPTGLPTLPTTLPSGIPTTLPSDIPTTLPSSSGLPTDLTSGLADLPTGIPTSLPTSLPTGLPGM
jgi:hypothetical protein